jgi:hypothetical protein
MAWREHSIRKWYEAETHLPAVTPPPRTAFVGCHLSNSPESSKTPGEPSARRFVTNCSLELFALLDDPRFDLDLD